jgi:hypothetical protein
VSTELDDLDWPPVEPRAETGATGLPCRHPRYQRTPLEGGGWSCPCGKTVEARSLRRGRQSRNYGNRAELSAARLYGGVKIGHAGGPVDFQGAEWSTQMKTMRRPPPSMWTSVFNALAPSAGARSPRLLLRFVMGPGVPPRDYFVVPAADWLARFGKDE